MCINNAALPTFTRSKVFPPLPCTDTPLMTLPNVLKLAKSAEDRAQAAQCAYMHDFIRESLDSNNNF